MDVLTIGWWIGGKSPAEPAQDGASPTGYVRRLPLPEDNEDDILMLLITEILLNE